jgi:hypothetical protein
VTIFKDEDQFGLAKAESPSNAKVVTVNAFHQVIYLGDALAQAAIERDAIIAKTKENAKNQAKDRGEAEDAFVDLRDPLEVLLALMRVAAKAKRKADLFLDSQVKAIRDRNKETISQALSEASDREEIEAFSVAIEEIAFRLLQGSFIKVFKENLVEGKNAIDAFDLTEAQIAGVLEIASQIPEPRKILELIRAYPTAFARSPERKPVCRSLKQKPKA